MAADKTTAADQATAAADQAIAQLTALAEQAVATHKEITLGAISSYEDSVLRLVGSYEQAVADSGLEWLKDAVAPQAKATRELTGAYVTAARKLVN